MVTIFFRDRKPSGANFSEKKKHLVTRFLKMVLGTHQGSPWPKMGL
jgi:hypothetical protein